MKQYRFFYKNKYRNGNGYWLSSLEEAESIAKYFCHKYEKVFIQSAEDEISVVTEKVIQDLEFGAFAIAKNKIIVEKNNNLPLKPSDFVDAYCWDSLSQSARSESIMMFLMSMLTKKNEWGILTYEDYVESRKQIGKEYCDKFVFEKVSSFTESSVSALSFCIGWLDEKFLS